jgi:hypothetical protein
MNLKSRSKIKGEACLGGVIRIAPEVLYGWQKWRESHFASRFKIVTRKTIFGFF